MFLGRRPAPAHLAVHLMRQLICEYVHQKVDGHAEAVFVTYQAIDRIFPLARSSILENPGSPSRGFLRRER